MTEVFILEIAGGFKWYLISEYNSHIIAQGFTKRRTSAVRQAEQELYNFTTDIAA